MNSGNTDQGTTGAVGRKAIWALPVLRYNGQQPVAVVFRNEVMKIRHKWLGKRSQRSYLT
jgi:hypothetical protein